jgi:hypothetical protein
LGVHRWRLGGAAEQRCLGYSGSRVHSWAPRRYALHARGGSCVLMQHPITPWDTQATPLLAEGNAICDKLPAPRPFSPRPVPPWPQSGISSTTSWRAARRAGPRWCCRGWPSVTWPRSTLRTGTSSARGGCAALCWATRCMPAILCPCACGGRVRCAVCAVLCCVLPLGALCSAPDLPCPELQVAGGWA